MDITGFRPIVALALAAVSICIVPAAPAQDQDPPSVAAILDRALVRAKWVEEHDFVQHYDYTMHRHIRKLHKSGDDREETLRFHVAPVDGAPYARLVQKNGQPLAGEELARERERERLFREALAKRAAAGEEEGGSSPDREEDEYNITFNEALLGRYEFDLTGVEPLHDRAAYRLAFRPRPGPLPVRRRLDIALNKAQGELWIDTETYEVARVRFELIEKVRIWWGLVGSISEARGELERRPVRTHEEVWLPSRLEMYVDARVLFRRNRRAETTTWSDYRPTRAAN